jgi:hypothetical protein
VIQVGVVIALIPVVIYLFSAADTVTAVGFLIWAILVAPVDNLLKLGAVVLALGYKLFLAWLAQDSMADIVLKPSKQASGV